MALSLARFDEVLRESEVSQRVYPTDDDFRLLQSLALAAKGELSSASAVVTKTQIDNQDKQKWTHFCEQIEFITTKLTNEDRSGQLNLEVIKRLGEQFQASFQPLINQRRWHFPPRIAQMFANLPDFSSFTLKNDRASISETAIAIAKSHPEASLLTLAGRTCIDTNQPTIQDLKEARKLFQMALEYPGFLKDAHHHAKLGIVATSVQLALVKKHDVEVNTKLFVDAVTRIAPESVNEPIRLQTISMVLIKTREWALAEAWSRRWSESPGESKAQRVNSLWHYGIVLENQKQWQELVTVCDKILEIDPDMQTAKDFRAGAIHQLKTIIETDK